MKARPSLRPRPSAPRAKARRRPAAKTGGGARPAPLSELAELREKLRVAQETLDAIRNGEVDAVIVRGANGDQVYSLAGAEQPYRVYIERMQEGAVTVAPDGLILYCNRRFAEMLGRPLERVISSSLIDHLMPQAWSHLRNIFADRKEVVKYESALRPRQGGPLPVNLTASHFEVEGPGMMCLVVTDLTSRKEQEALRLAKELAERANIAKDDFLAALSHELRTPLTPALMAATALEKDGTLPETARTTLALIRRNIELEARLIDDLLDLTLITHGKLTLQRTEVDVHTGLQRALEIVEADARAKHVTLRVELNATQSRITGDPVRLQQVCWNVLRNAVKFSAEGGLITITTGNATDHSLWLRITDKGIGFTPEQGGRIFAAFEQGSRSITRQFGGLGLGLAITRSIMNAHGGRIEAESRGPGHGAAFTLHFPPGPAKASPAGKVTAAAADTASLAILLVEDHKDTRQTIQRLLEMSRHRVTAASDAGSALALAGKSRFDLVISDLGLPDLTGHELMRQLRQRFALTGIALSGYGMENDVAESLAAGFRFHLTKPVSFDQLKKRLAEFSHQPPVTPATAGAKP